MVLQLKKEPPSLTLRAVVAQDDEQKAAPQQGRRPPLGKARGASGGIQ